jgi:predicted KAP-like P-loop ATPase
MPVKDKHRRVKRAALQRMRSSLGQLQMSGDDSLKLSDDAPKQNPWLEDRLGFKPFAERLSKVILSLEVPNGYVIGLHGEWGSGKSTAINFVKAFLDKHNVEAEDEASRIEILDFRPWIVSGHQDLITAFFKVLSEKRGRLTTLR